MSLESAVAAEGQNIVENILRSLLGELPCYRVACNQGSIAGILHKLNCLCPALLVEWIQKPLSAVGEGSKSILLDALKEQSSSAFYEHVERFARFCNDNQKMGR